MNRDDAFDMLGDAIDALWEHAPTLAAKITALVCDELDDAQ